MKRRQGFTLLELMAVMLIIVLLMTLLLPAVLKVKTRVREKRANVECKAITTAIQAYHSQYHAWPCPESDLNSSRDVTYGVDGENNRQVIDILAEPPEGETPYINVNDFRRDSQGNILSPFGGQYRILLDLNYDREPSSGVSVSY